MSMIIFLTRLGKTTSSSSTTQQPSISRDSMLNIQQIMHADIWQDILTKDRVYESTVEFHATVSYLLLFSG